MRALGMSLRSACGMLAAFRESRSAADEARVRAKGEKKAVGIVTDARTGHVLGLDALVERDSDTFMDCWRTARANSGWRRLQQTT